MKKELACKFSIFQGIDCSENDIMDEPEFISTDDDLMKVLNEIFSVDEVSGLPKGDLAYYLSPDGNPTVKAWLETNLLKPRAAKVGSSIEGVTDDMIVEMSKGSDETAEHYAARLVSIFNEAKAEYDKSIDLNKSL